MLMEEYVSPKDRQALNIDDYSEVVENAKSQYELFNEVCSLAKEYIYEIYNENVQAQTTNSTQQNYIDIYHQAMLGSQSSIEMIKTDIANFISNKNYKRVTYPNHYKNIVDAIYEEEFGWGALSVWKEMGNSEGAKVIGTDVYFKDDDGGYNIQDFSFRSLDQVHELCARFSNLDAKTDMNEFNKTELETNTKDGFRVSMMIPSRTIEEPVITLRKQTEVTHSFKRLAELKSFPEEVIRVMEILCRLKLNSCIAGPPGCGKSTMLLTMLKYIANSKESTLYVQENEEFNPRKLFPHSLVHPVLATGHEFEKIVSKSMLRHDIVNVVIGEIREFEAGLYRRAALQGIKQLIGTLHDLDPLDIPGILKDLYLIYSDTKMSEESVYKVFVKNLHFTISMDELQGSKKRITSIQFHDFDSGEAQIIRIMLYDHETDSWTFQSQIPERIIRIAEKYSRDSVNELISELQRLEKMFPMPMNERVIKEKG